MGRVKDHLLQLIQRQLKDHNLLVWFDPDQYYAGFVDALQLGNLTMAHYDGSFFALRRQIEPFLSNQQTTPLLVYVPRAEELARLALAEICAVAAILRPRADSPERNTTPAEIARQALLATLGPGKADELALQVTSGRLSLDDLDKLDQQDGGSAVLRVVFGTTAAQEIARKFITEPLLDKAISEHDAMAEVAEALHSHFGLPIAIDSTPDALRERLAQHALIVEFIESLNALPQTLASVTLPENVTQRENCAQLVDNWRGMRDHADTYAKAASRAEATLMLARVGLTLAQARDSETFQGVETSLQQEAELVLARGADDARALEIGNLAALRLKRFWSTQRVDAGDRWRLIQTTAQIILASSQMEAEMKRIGRSPTALIDAYATGVDGSAPWCLLDTYFRNLERLWFRIDYEEATGVSLEGMRKQAISSYMRAGGALAEVFAVALASVGFKPTGIQRQRDVFATVVKPAQSEGRTAYVLVDALRYEMAHELFNSLREEFSASLGVVLGTVPGITSIGMAALMPGAEQEDVTIEQQSAGALALRIGGYVLKDRASRVEWFKKSANGPVAESTLERILPKPNSALEKELKAASIALITSQEIDEIAESDNVPVAREMMNGALEKLARLVRVLRRLGFKRIILTADHGHLFGEELDDSMKVEPPGGDTVSLHRRVWVGRGGAASGNFIRARLSQFGLGSDLELASPIGFGAFTVRGGARAYFHGGLSPQELVLPVLVLKASETPASFSIALTIEPLSKKLSTSIYTVKLSGEWTGMFRPDAQRVRVELRQGKEAITDVYDATYGLDRSTQELDLKPSDSEPAVIEPNYVTLRLTRKPGDVTAKTVTLSVTDAATGAELAKVDKIIVSLLDL